MRGAARREPADGAPKVCDVYALLLDMDAGVCDVAVNGVVKRRPWTELRGRTLWPAVFMHAVGSRMKIRSCVSSEPAAGAHAGRARVAGADPPHAPVAAPALPPVDAGADGSAGTCALCVGARVVGPVPGFALRVRRECCLAECVCVCVCVCDDVVAGAPRAVQEQMDALRADMAALAGRAARAEAAAAQAADRAARAEASAIEATGSAARAEAAAAAATAAVAAAGGGRGRRPRGWRRVAAASPRVR